VSFAAITICVASQRVFIVVVYFVIDSVRKLLDTPSYAGADQSYILFVGLLPITKLSWEAVTWGETAHDI
jgi:hypothetical protein